MLCPHSPPITGSPSLSVLLSVISDRSWDPDHSRHTHFCLIDQHGVPSPALPQDSQLPPLPPWVAPCPWLLGDDSVEW